MDDRAFELPEQFILAKQASLLRTLFKSVAILTAVAILLIVFLPGFSKADDVTEPALRRTVALVLIGLLYLALERGHVLATIFTAIGVCAGMASYTVYMESPDNMQMMALLMLPVGLAGFLPRRSQFWMVYAFSMILMLLTCWLLISVKGVELENRSITTLGILMTLLAIIVDSLASSYRESITTTFNQLKEIQAAETRLIKLDKDLDTAVSERIRAESVSSQLERTSQLALEAAGAAPLCIDPGSGLLQTSDEFFSRFGLETAPSTLSSLLDCIHPDDIERFRAFFSSDNQKSRVESEFRVNIERPVFWMFLVEPVHYGHGCEKRVLLQGIIVDVTTRVQRREHLQKEDHKANESQRLESLGMLAGAIAHDFNNLLHVIMLNADLARQELNPDSKPATSLHRLMKTVDHAAELCNELLAYSGRGQFSIEPVNPLLLVQEMRNLLELSVPKGVQIDIQHDDSKLLCEADVTQLRQIIMNLVINAGDAVKKSGGRVTLNIRAGRFDEDFFRHRDFIETVAAGDYVSIKVADNGVGMDRETMARMFDPFFSTKESGHGLGLSAALGIVKSHNGTIEVRSQPDQGTEITFLLPAPKQREITAAEQPPPTQPGNRGVILFVDDEADIRQLARIVLEDDGYTIIEAADGQQAIDIFKTEHENLQLVILDLMMPNITGLEAYIEIRQLDTSVPVVFSSGFNENEALQSLPEKARAAFLKKPYLAEDLRQFVNSLIGPRQLD